MKRSARATRMARHHKRWGKSAQLNLVSLMDIFTILVFFLLVNSSSSQQMSNQKSVKLPESTAERKPEQTLTIHVTQGAIIVEGRKVADTRRIMSSNQRQVPALAEELKFQAQNAILPTADQGQSVGRAVTIMGDKRIPYQLLKKIMYTCSQNNYTRISLAVLQKPEATSS